MTRFALIPALCAALALAQDDQMVRVERVVSGLRFTEGPVWHKDGYLLFTDIPSARILKLAPGKPLETIREKSGGANGLALDEHGRLIVCEGEARQVTRTDAKGRVEVLASKFEGKALNAPNDVAVRKDGHIYFTDPAFGKSEDSKELPFYGVFHLTPKGELSVAARWGKRPNGVALSPTGKILYVAGSDERVIRAYDVDRQGNLSNERTLITGLEGPPDGIKTDEKGNIYAACNDVVVYGPDGKFLRKHELPEKPSNLAFGDGDMLGLWITAKTSVYHMRVEVKGWSIFEP
ncbi:MAG: SMP-30/gluconolactonase/LRE family protein [Acidobacteria bacterium]|nr:SMP-30/gluconolactonase/LRE family protein [Acidobacteriota bacterium]